VIIDSFLWCTSCGQFRSGSNLSRHRKACVTAADKGNEASQKSESGGTGVSVSVGHSLPLCNRSLMSILSSCSSTPHLVSSSAGAKVSAAATVKSVKSCSATSRLTHSTRHGDRKRASPYHRRAGSPRRRQSRGRSDYYHRLSVTYTVGAEEYRHLQDFMRQSRYKK